MQLYEKLTGTIKLQLFFLFINEPIFYSCLKCRDESVFSEYQAPILGKIRFYFLQFFEVAEFNIEVNGSRISGVPPEQIFDLCRIMRFFALI